MANLIRRPRTGRLGLWDDDLDRMFEGFFRPARWLEEAPSEDMVPAIDISERADAFVVKAELPGVRKEDIDVNMENGVLTISAETKSDTEEKEGDRLIRQERRYGKYVRSLRLGTHIDETKVKASYKDGVLHLVLPKAEEVKPKKISVNVG